MKYLVQGQTDTSRRAKRLDMGLTYINVGAFSTVF